MITAVVHGSGAPLIVMVCLVLAAGMIVFIANDIYEQMEKRQVGSEES